MKSLKQNIFKIWLLIALLVVITKVDAQKDSVAKKQFDSVKHLGDSLKKKADSMKQLFDSGKIVVFKMADTTHKAATANCIQCRDEKPGLMEWLLILLPIIVFIILLSVLLSGLKDFNLKEAMSENENPKMIVKNDAYTDAFKAENFDKLKDIQNLEEVLPPTIEVSVATTGTAPHASISRFIAFITSILTLSIALCLSCFFMYHYIRSGCAPDISSMTTVLLSLGIGVLPYAFNKLSTALSNNKDE